jgi:hypothetical protein
METTGSGPSSDREPLAGLVERVTFHNADNGFCVLRVKARGHSDLVTVLGAARSIAAGEYIQASGTWENHREHGLQFRATFLRVTAPTLSRRHGEITVALGKVCRFLDYGVSSRNVAGLLARSKGSITSNRPPPEFPGFLGSSLKLRADVMTWRIARSFCYSCGRARWRL